MTPLHIACKENDIDTVKLLVEKGANVNAKSDDEISFIQRINKTPLLLACAKSSKIAEFLIESGADIKAETIPTSSFVSFSHENKIHSFL